MIARWIEVIVRDRRYWKQRLVYVRSFRAAVYAAPAYRVLILEDDEKDDRFTRIGLGICPAERDERNQRQKSKREEPRHASWNRGRLHTYTSNSCCPHDPTIELPAVAQSSFASDTDGMRERLRIAEGTAGTIH